ncbi:unnamed protein product [Notodromas monacha]|uniref:Glutamate-gated chloride channel n=1 Tax=Notodromas monacha TaxID=399045 RepID=A0A7R9BGY1_9CRUS|nr:unnamed protein product [Notodromas monacha]CAG0915268.1 unnamed protein product [Notodromas monacha]
MSLLGPGTKLEISLTLSCPMDLKLYPLDRQTCQLRMASYGWTTDDLVFLWKDGDPVQIVKKLHLPRFTLEKFFTDYCNSKTNTGEYSCLRVDLRFKREFSYYLIQIYIPCCMLVIVSWVSFWLDQNAIPARVSLGVTTLLTMATQTSGINASLPPVSYTKAIDVWTGVCLTFVFGALLEFALVNYASRSDMHRENMKKQQRRQWELEQAALEAAAASQDHLEDGATFPMKPLMRHPSGHHHHHHHHPHNNDPLGLEKARQCEIHMTPQTAQATCKSWLSKFPTRSKRIDVVSRITFPLKPLMRHPSGHHHHHHHHPHNNDPLGLEKARQCEIHMTPQTAQATCKSWLSKFPTRSKRIDVVSRITFPLVFALFNLVYWSTYLFQEEEKD